MSQELQKIEAHELQHRNTLPLNSIQDAEQAGKLLAQANYLGTRSPGEGFLVMAACQQRGEDLVSFQQRYHLRQGRFSMQAHEMLAQLERRGGGYEIIQRDEECASLKLWKGDRVYTSTLTWEQAKQEPFVYAGNENEQLAQLDLPFEKRRLKNKYKTPRSIKQMLWSRVVSDGVVVVDPGARGGIYTPEETEDFTEDAAPAQKEEKEVSSEQAQEAINVESKSADNKPEQNPKQETKEETKSKDKSKDKSKGKPGRPPKNKQKESASKSKDDSGKETAQKDSQTAEKNSQSQNSQGQDDQGPNPWDEAEKETDFSVCPVDHPKVKGVKWVDMETDWLKEAHKKAAELNLEQGHISIIEQVLKERGEI